VRENCADYPAGLINYLHFYFCDLSHAPAAATVLLVSVSFCCRLLCLLLQTNWQALLNNALL
jgi:hypothetical protein